MIRFSLKIAIFILLGSCVTPIDFDIPILDTDLVVSGKLTNLTEPHLLFVGTTVQGRQPRKPLPLGGVTARLMNDKGVVANYKEISPGNYRLETDSIPPSFGSSYFLDMTLPDGQLYRSLPEEMPDAVAFGKSYFSIDTVSVIDREGDLSNTIFARIFTNAQIPRNGLLLKWNVVGTFAVVPTPRLFRTPPPCYVSQPADGQRIVLFNGIENSTSEVTGVEVARKKVDVTFYYRYYFSVFIESVTARAFDYWKKVNILVTQTGSIFDTPPAEITGNIYNVRDNKKRVFGYFQVCRASVDRFYITRADIPVYLGTYCDIPLAFDPLRPTPPKECDDCIDLPGASNEIPSWWK